MSSRWCVVMGITAFVIYKISTLSLIRTFELDYLMKSKRAGLVDKMRSRLEDLEHCSRRPC